MARFTASIVITAQENLGRVSERVSKGFGKMTKSAKLNEKQIARLRKANDKLGRSISNVARRSTFAFAAASIAGFKFASDADEVRSKFGVIFRDIRDDAEATADEFAKDFGLAGSSARKLLGNTADLLSGFGFTQEAALDMSDKVNRLSADLASFSNIQGGAARASEAITKGLLGERESMKLLGIAVREADIEKELGKRGLKGLEGRELRAAKALITFDLAFEQSANAIGDYERTNQSAANQMRLTQERLKAFTERFGKEVIMPLAENVLPAINKFLGDEERVSDLLDKIKKGAETTATFIELVYHGIMTVAEGVTAVADWFRLLDNPRAPSTIAGGITATGERAITSEAVPTSGLIGRNAPLQLSITLDGAPVSVRNVESDNDIDFEIIDYGLITP